MRLFLVTDGGWARGYSLVRADSPERAIELTGPHGSRFECEELSADGCEAVLWSHEDDPDSRPD